MKFKLYSCSVPGLPQRLARAGGWWVKVPRSDGLIRNNWVFRFDGVWSWPRGRQMGPSQFSSILIMDLRKPLWSALRLLTRPRSALIVAMISSLFAIAVTSVTADQCLMSWWSQSDVSGVIPISSSPTGENIPILDSPVTVTILYLLAAVRNPIWVSDGGSSDMPGGAQIFYSKRKRSTLENKYWKILRVKFIWGERKVTEPETRGH